MYCINCGTKLEDDSVFCPECGVRQNNEQHSSDSFILSETPASNEDIVCDPTSGEFDSDPIDSSMVEESQSSAWVKEKFIELIEKLKTIYVRPKGKLIIWCAVVCVIIAGVVLFVLIPHLNSCFSDEQEEYNAEIKADSNGEYYYIDEYGNTVWLYDLIVSSADTVDSVNTGDTQSAQPVKEYNIRWLFGPQIEADNIDVMHCVEAQSENFEKYEYNSIGMHKYDRISLIERNGMYGMIIYNGGIVTGVDFQYIEVGYEQKYLLVTPKNDSTIYYTFTPLYELQKLSESEAYEISSDDIIEQPIWVENEGLYVGSDGSFYEWKYDGREISEVMAVPYIPEYAVDDWMDASYATGWVIVKNEQLVNSVVYEDAGCFSDGVIPVKLNGKWGYVNECGEVVLPLEYDACWDTAWGMMPYNASDGCIVVHKNGQYAMYDVNGNLVIDFGEYEYLRPVYEGMCWARYNGLWGVLGIDDHAVADRAEKPIIEVNEYSARVNSSNGLRMREGPGTNCCVIDMLSNNKKVIVCGETGDWSYVRSNGVYGWVKTEFLS